MRREHIHKLMVALGSSENVYTDHVPTDKTNGGTEINGIGVTRSIVESYSIDNDIHSLTQHWYKKNNILGYKALKNLPTRTRRTTS